MIPDPSTEQPETPRSRSRRRLQSVMDARARRQRLVTYALVFVSAVLFANAVVGENGYLAMLRARRDYARVAAALQAIETQNAQYQLEAARLKADPHALEDAARRDLGLLRPGETLIIVHDALPNAPGSGTR
jgi:cell division protein FtsB